METLLTLDEIVGCKVVEGSMMKELFLEWLEFNVVHTIELIVGFQRTDALKAA